MPEAEHEMGQKPAALHHSPLVAFAVALVVIFMVALIFSIPHFGG